jgi:hypothetical protein
MNIKKEWKYVLFIVLLSIPSSVPLISSGFYEPHDLHHFADIYQMLRAFELGQTPPRWGPDFLFGFGYPLFNFYYLAPFYIGALFYMVFGSLIVSFKLTFLSTILLSVVGMYLLLREFVGKWSASAGSILFLYTPYRAVQVYVRGAMGEALALSLLPFVLWGIVRIIKKPRDKKTIAATSILTALFILSHNYLWALSVPFILLLILFIINVREIKDALLGLVLVGIFALGLTAYWWIPALVEQNLVVSKTPFPLIDHFPFIKQLIIPSWGYGSSVWGPNDEISFQVGIVNILVFLFVCVLFVFKRKLSKNLSRLSMWVVLGFVLSFIFMNIRTYPIWKLIPFHNFIQFPWRLLLFTTLFTSFCAAIFIESLKKKKRKFIGALIVFVSIALTFSYFKPSSVFFKTDNEYLTRFFAFRSTQGETEQASEEYLNYSEDYLLFPKWVEKKPYGVADKEIEIAKGIGEILHFKYVGRSRWKGEVVAESPITVVFNVMNFPGWYAKIDGRTVEISSGKPYGQIEIYVLSGTHTVEFLWRETNLRLFSDFLSVLSLVILILYLTTSRKYMRFKQ